MDEYKEKKPTVCSLDQCVGCMACLATCRVGALQLEDSVRAYNVVKSGSCIDCKACELVCPQNNPPQTVLPIQCYQGWALDENIRMKGASGGCASDIAKAFVECGGVVCSCAFENGTFGFSIARKADDLLKFAGSKYVKSNPGDIYFQVKRLLKDGEKVLYIALPCQVAAMKNFVGAILQEKLYTIDLICHGTPSPKVLEQFTGQYGVQLKDVKQINFREKRLNESIKTGFNYFSAKGTADCYTLAFHYGLSYTENCYSCRYAKTERVSDISLGDFWGVCLDHNEIRKGVSLLLCQTIKGKDLLDAANIVLKEADMATAVSHNDQLQHPSVAPASRKRFLYNMKNGVPFNRNILTCLTMACARQFVKKICIMMKIKKINEVGTYYCVTYK